MNTPRKTTPARYPLLNATVAADDVPELSKRSGVAVESINAILNGTHAASLSVRDRIGEALGIDPRELFALDTAAEAALADVERQGFPRFITDPAVLRVIDQ